jgi:hypothetical protein
MMAGMSIDMFIDPDPRSEPPPQGGELETLSGFLRWQRETLELKCSGLDAAGLARRSVEPSPMSLLGAAPAPGRRRAGLVPELHGRPGRAVPVLLARGS